LDALIHGLISFCISRGWSFGAKGQLSGHGPGGMTLDRDITTSVSSFKVEA
jgi:hypothetical protein